MDNKRIGFVSTLFAGTDGVSLEAKKWSDVLTNLGHDSFWFGGAHTGRHEPHCRRKGVSQLDGFLTRDAVDRVRALLLDPERRREMTDRNFEIARRFFSYRMLEQRLTGLLQSFFGASPEVARGSDLLP